MHTLHWLAVEAESKLDAFQQVQVALDQEEGYGPAAWSDWHIVGGGRWSDSQYQDSPDMVMAYADDPLDFGAKLFDIGMNRRKEAENLLADLDIDKFLNDVNNYIADFGNTPPNYQDFNTYYLKSLANLIDHRYSANSYYFDVVMGTPSLSYLRDRIAEKPENQYLVPVDFHY